MPEKLDTRMQVGLRARRTDRDKKPYGFVVTWIPWDSGFRGTDLQVGDVITSIDDKVFTPQQKDYFDFGQYSERQHWDKRGAKDDTPTTLTVLREGKTVKITGKVRADRFYSSNDGKRTIGLDGPGATDSDGFNQTWFFWAEDAVKLFAAARLALYQQNTRLYLQDLESYRERIDYLAKHFPKSAFARAMKDDFDKAIDLIRGRKYDLTEDDIAYRKLAADRLEKARALATKARDDFLAKVAAMPFDALPPTDPLYGNRKAIAGTVVILPTLKEEISEAGHGWYAPRGAGGSVFLVDTRLPAFIAIFRAMERFKQRVDPEISNIFEMIGRVTDRPTMVATSRTLYSGIIVEPVAALVDGRMFVDVSGGSRDAPFAGEAEAARPPRVDTRTDMTPSETFRAFIDALKLGDFDLWKSFFAAWSCEPTGISQQRAFDPENGPLALQSLDSFFVKSRRTIMSAVYDMRVVKEGAPEQVYDKDGTRVEMVELDVDPVGLFDGEYRSFRSVEVHRVWHMQRVNGGPWRIASEQGL